MRHIIYDRTKADVEISAPGKILAPAKLPRLSKPLRLSKVRRKSPAPIESQAKKFCDFLLFGLGRISNSDFLQLWLKSFRSDPHRQLSLVHVDLKRSEGTGRSVFMGGVSPVLYRLVIPARLVKTFAEVFTIFCEKSKILSLSSPSTFLCVARAVQQSIKMLTPQVRDNS